MSKSPPLERSYISLCICSSIKKHSMRWQLCNKLYQTKLYGNWSWEQRREEWAALSQRIHWLRLPLGCLHDVRGKPTKREIDVDSSFKLKGNSRWFAQIRNSSPLLAFARSLLIVHTKSVNGALCTCAPHQEAAHHCFPVITGIFNGNMGCAKGPFLGYSR